MTEGPIISTRGITKRYGDLTAVDGVDLDVAPGTFLGILGPNGAGKTTLLEMIEGIREPDEGYAQILGEPVWPRRTSLMPRIGVQLQASSFFERLSVDEQLRTFAALYGVPAAASDAVLEQVGLSQKRSTMTEDLSGGQRQRLAIACALVHGPEVVFLDEPSAALDPQARRNLWDVLRSIHDEGRTIVLTTHHLDEAELLCDEVAILDHGRILARDRPRALITGLGRAQRILLEADGLTREEAAGLPGVESASMQEGTLSLATHAPARVLTALSERSALRGLQVSSATLEDVFLELTGREYRP